jgi:hypothetical protein
MSFSSWARSRASTGKPSKHDRKILGLDLGQIARGLLEEPPPAPCRGSRRIVPSAERGVEGRR